MLVSGNRSCSCRQFAPPFCFFEIPELRGQAAAQVVVLKLQVLQLGEEPELRGYAAAQVVAVKVQVLQLGKQPELRGHAAGQALVVKVQFGAAVGAVADRRLEAADGVGPRRAGKREGENGAKHVMPS